MFLAVMDTNDSNETRDEPELAIDTPEEIQDVPLAPEKPRVTFTIPKLSVAQRLEQSNRRSPDRKTRKAKRSRSTR
jgi:hypothetical protein